MMKTKSTTKNTKGIVSRVKKILGNANELALSKTEETVTTSIEITAQWQTVAEKALKGGLK
ncbi:MAG: hypothetical protein ACFB0A_00800 [Croceivirga sp.]